MVLRGKVQTNRHFYFRFLILDFGPMSKKTKIDSHQHFDLVARPKNTMDSVISLLLRLCKNDLGSSVPYEGRSWTKCWIRRFVVAFHRFGTPILLVDSLFSEVDQANCQFDLSAGLVCRFVLSFHHFIMPFRRLGTPIFLVDSFSEVDSSIRRLVSFVVSSFRYGVLLFRLVH